MCIYPLLYFANIYEHLLSSASTKIYQDLYIDHISTVYTSKNEHTIYIISGHVTMS